MGANILNYVKIKGCHCRLHLIMEILISIIEIHTSVYIYMPYQRPGRLGYMEAMRVVEP